MMHSMIVVTMMYKRVSRKKDQKEEQEEKEESGGTGFKPGGCQAVPRKPCYCRGMVNCLDRVFPSLPEPSFIFAEKVWVPLDRLG